VFAISVLLLAAQLAAPPSESLLAAWGGPSQFPPLYRTSLDAFFTAEGAYRGGDYEKASRVLTTFWEAHPPGTPEWERAIRHAQTLATTKGVNFGAPAFYYALRMLTDCVEWRLHGDPKTAAHTVRWTVVLVGKSNDGEVHHSLATPTGDYVGESTYLFTEYIRAITGGRLKVDVRLLPLPELDVPVERLTRSVQAGGASFDVAFADLAPAGMPRIWKAVPDEVRAKTDWWWVLYPSHVPPGATTNFITGGMSVGPDGVSPAFIIDDLWLVRIPPTLGSGPYTSEQRRAYLPQWLQHEFFHHLYRSYPALGLETSGHQWFDRKLWPDDFNGLLEPDYFAESVHKRLKSASPPLDVMLRYAR
jgi:hypothetical protein